MTFEFLSEIFRSWGYQIPTRNYWKFDLYFREMLKRERVMAIYDGPLLTAILIFYLTDDFNKVYKKGSWDLAIDNPEGHQIYIDKFACQRFRPVIHRLINEAVAERFPNVTEALYHREPNDRLIRIQVKRSLIFQEI